MMDELMDVIIIGYGPSGLVLASSLGQQGHRVAVVERWPTLFGLPRLSHLDDETARIVQATSDVEVALRDAEPINNFEFVNAAGELLTSIGEPMTGPCGYPAEISIYQPDIEDAIDQRVAEQPSVERLLGWEAVLLLQDANQAIVTVRSAATGEERELRARYVVGCDGARSFVRQELGIERTDYGFNEQWLNIDVEKLRDLPADFDRNVQFCDPARGHMHLPIGSKRLRFELAILPGEDVEPFKAPDFAWTWLREQHGLGPDDVKIIRHIAYTFEARVADTWRSGRVLLAGDACHTMPPYMGQGACSGMRDGYNLGWRLDLVLRGVSSAVLLDGYQEERKPHVEIITQMAIGLGRIANEHDPERARMRDDALKTHPPKKMEFPIIRHGLLDPERSARVGTIWPQGRVTFEGNTGRFDDVVGRGFVLLSRSPLTNAIPDGIRRGFQRVGGRIIALDEFEDLEGKYEAFFDSHRISMVLARPDFIIFGTGSTDEDANRLIAALLDRLPDQSVSAPLKEAVQ